MKLKCAVCSKKNTIYDETHAHLQVWKSRVLKTQI